MSSPSGSPNASAAESTTPTSGRQTTERTWVIELKSQASPTNSDFSDTDSTPDTDSGPAPYFTGPTADVTDSDASDTEATPGTLKAFGKEIRTLFKDILDKHFKTPEKEPGQPEVPLPPCVDIFNSFKERPSSSMEQYEKLKYRFDKQCKDLKSKSEDQSRSNEQSKHQSEETPDSKFEHEYQVRQLEFILRFERSAFLRWADENLLFIKRHDDSLDGKVKSVEWASKIERENRRFDKKLYRHMSGLVDESFKASAMLNDGKDAFRYLDIIHIYARHMLYHIYELHMATSNICFQRKIYGSMKEVGHDICELFNELIRHPHLQCSVGELPKEDEPASDIAPSFTQRDRDLIDDGQRNELLTLLQFHLKRFQEWAEENGLFADDSISLDDKMGKMEAKHGDKLYFALISVLPKLRLVSTLLAKYKVHNTQRNLEDLMDYIGFWRFSLNGITTDSSFLAGLRAWSEHQKVIECQPNKDKLSSG